MSYWHTDLKSKFLNGDKFIYETIKFIEVSANLIKNHYGNINLITDEIGQKYLSNIINWTSINTCLKHLPKEYKKVWSLGKLEAIKNISKNKEPFLHIDHDVFILKKISEDLLNKSILLQSYDRTPLKGPLAHNFNLHCKNKQLISNECIPEKHYNCGIIGGTNFDFFYKFSKSSIDMVLDKQNEDFWIGDNEKEYLFEYFSKALIAEQYYLAAYMQENNITPDLLLNYDYSPKEQDIKNGYIHLYGSKKNKYEGLFNRVKNIYLSQNNN